MLPLKAKLNAATQPFTDASMDGQWDADTQAGRDAEDQNADPLAGTPGHASAGMIQFNRSQQDAATGAGGFNRQWVPLLQSLKNKRVRANPTAPSLMDDPNSTFSQASGPYGDFGTGTGGQVVGGDERLQQALAGLKTKGLKY
jgi:hypothetical protein